MIAGINGRRIVTLVRNGRIGGGGDVLTLRRPKSTGKSGLAGRTNNNRGEGES